MGSRYIEGSIYRVISMGALCIGLLYIEPIMSINKALYINMALRIGGQIKGAYI